MVRLGIRDELKNNIMVPRVSGDTGEFSAGAVGAREGH